MNLIEILLTLQDHRSRKDVKEELDDLGVEPDLQHHILECVNADGNFHLLDKNDVIKLVSTPVVAA